MRKFNSSWEQILKNKCFLICKSLQNILILPPVKPPVNKLLPSWMQNPPQTFEEKVHLLHIKSHRIKEQTPEGSFLRALLNDVKQIQKEAQQVARRLDPLAFAKPSYEQALVLNCWLYGIQWIGIYTANRMGKTAVAVWNFLLWILPNNPKWRIFRKYVVGALDQSYPDDPKEDPNNPNLGKIVHVLQRPPIATLALINKAIKRLPLSIPSPDPLKQYYNPANQPFLQWLQKEVPAAFKRAYPNPPWNKSGTLWFGGPDHDHFEQIIMPIWKEWTPESYLTRYVVTNRSITIEVPTICPAFISAQSSKVQSIPPSVQIGQHVVADAARINKWEFVGKSFDAKTEKWSSGAVDAILITEGMPWDKWKEIKARFKDPAIGSHDFTPFEPTNSGASASLASKILKGIEPVPLPSFVFTGWSVHTAPRHIISQQKYEGLVNSYKDDPEGQARLEGKFYSSSALVLSNFNRELHLLDWSIQQLFQRYPNAQLFRGIDPGLDHPTACAWGALLPTNQWVIYRILCQAGLSISARCKLIIELSNNKQEQVRWGPRKEDFYLQETHPHPNSEVFIANPIDYHVFKEDETTGQSYSLNYLLNGLAITESVHTGPEERAQKLDDLLQPSQFSPHLLTNTPPGPRIYFLKNSPGVMAAALRWEEFYWDRKRSGDDKGSPKDKVPVHGDDELDAVCYLTSSLYRWTSFRPAARLPRDSEPEPRLIRAAQANQTKPRSFATIAKADRSGNLASQKISYFGQSPQDAERDESDSYVDRLY